MITYEGPLYGKMGRRYIKLRHTSETIDQMEKELVDVEYLVRNWVSDSTQLDNASIKEMVLHALREEETDKREALRRARDAEERTNRLLQTRTDYHPHDHTLVASVKADATALSREPEAYAKVLAHELVKHIRSQLKNF